MRTLILAVTGFLLLASCSSNPRSTADTTVLSLRETAPAPVATTSPTGTTLPAPPVPPLLDVIDISAAVAINVASNGVDDPVIAWSETDAVQVARLDLSNFDLGPATKVNGSFAPIAHVIERPAISVGEDNVAHLAFTSLVGADGTVLYVAVSGDEPLAPVRISGKPQRETNLPHMTSGDGDDPAMAWLEDSTLSVGIPSDGAFTEIENVDDLTCDCCNPVPVRLGSRLTVMYRDLEHASDGVIRDIYAISTADGGESFEDPVLISDDHWYLDGCPFTGPTVVEAGDTLVVSWMDARQSAHPDQRTSTIWVDQSSDSGANFGPDVAITAGGLHRWPSMAIDHAGTIHLVWETQTEAGGISYSSSSSGVSGFSPAALLVPNTSDSGARHAPTVITHGEHLVVTWIDRQGGHVARFDLAALP